MTIELFQVKALGDKLLMPDGRIRYLLFFDADQRYSGSPVELWDEEMEGFEIFKTKNGFHAIGTIHTNAEAKRDWFHLWKKVYPSSDYILQNWNWLYPHGQAELDFILNVAAPALPKVVRYYRDKKVFETLAITTR